MFGTTVDGAWESQEQWYDSSQQNNEQLGLNHNVIHKNHMDPTKGLVI